MEEIIIEALRAMTFRHAWDQVARLVGRIAAGQYAPLILVLAGIFCAGGPFVFIGTPGGHDFGFHANTWLDVAEQGELLPRWPIGANFGFGDVRFLFYPPVSWLIGGSLCRLLPLRLVPGTYILLCLLAAGIAMYCLARNFLTRRQSIVAGTFFALSPYLLYDIYVRSAYAELLAIAFFAGAIHFLLRIHRLRARRDVALFAVTLSLVWLTDIPVALIASVILTILVLVLYATGGNRGFLMQCSVAVALAIGWSAFYTFGVVSELAWTNISDVEPHLTSRSDFQMAPLLLVIAGLQIIAAAVLIFQLYLKSNGAIVLRRLVVSLGASSILMLTPASIPIWNTSLLGFVEYPFRWLSVLALLFGLAAATILGARDRLIIIGSVAAVTAMICVPLFVSKRAHRSQQYLVQTRLAIQSGTGYKGSPASNWIPRQFIIDPSFEFQPPPLVSLFCSGAVRSGSLTDATSSAMVMMWKADRKLVVTDCPEAAIARFRVAFYPLWRITVNGAPTAASADEKGVLQANIPAGHNRIEIGLRTPPARKVGAVFSILSAVVTLLLAV